jgi:2-polyprenyl-3-methyl-5-hydroxy-6-metoxy-1,4-benzoquinol methylase
VDDPSISSRPSRGHRARQEQIVIDLDQARTRAKERLAAAKADDPTTSLRLADTQREIARELGYASWPRLVRDAERFVTTTYDDVEWRRVRRLTLVPFVIGTDEVALLADGQRLVLPTGVVEQNEDAFLDAALRIPLETMGLRRQETHVLATSHDRRHLVMWVDGARYAGARPHRRDAAWWTGPAAEAGALLDDRGDGAMARLVEQAEDARLNLTDEQYRDDLRRLLDPSYLRAATPQGGSGFGGGADEWRAARSMLCDAVEHDGTFLDVGCANGLLMESIVAWCAEKGVQVEPHGLDISAPLVDLARTRLPQWADRIWVGDALSWAHSDGVRFDVVHVLLDAVRDERWRDMIDHLLASVVAPGGRLLVSQYNQVTPENHAAAILTRLGYVVDGVTSVPLRPGRPDASPSAWVEAPTSSIQR